MAAEEGSSDGCEDAVNKNNRSSLELRLFLFCHPIRRPVLGALHKAIHNEIPPNRCIIFIDRSEDLVDLFFRV